MSHHRRTVKTIINLLFPRLLLHRYKTRALSLPLTKNYPYDPEFTIIKHISPLDAPFFDVGANEGIYSYLVNDMLDQEYIYCFEPMVKQYRLLKRRFKRAHVFNVALSDKIGKAELRIPFIRGSQCDYRATLERHVQEVGETGSRCIEISTTTLDRFVEENGINAIGFLKLDVEGHEYHVLRGGTVSLQRFRPIVLIEIEQRHHEHSVFEIMNYIQSMCFRGYYISLQELRLCSIEEFSVEKDQSLDKHKTGEYVNNFFFVPQEKENNITRQISDILNTEKTRAAAGSA